jgi:hypothetical protein
MFTIEQLRQRREAGEVDFTDPTAHPNAHPAKCVVCGTTLPAGVGVCYCDDDRHWTCAHCEIASRPAAERWWGDPYEALHAHECAPEGLPAGTDQVVTLEELHARTD